MGKLDVVFTIDRNYIQHFTVACTSLLENSGNCINRITLIHDIDRLKSLRKIFNYFNSKYNAMIEEIIIDSDLLNSMKTSHHISKATYFRLLLPEILPENIDRILFLDSDILVVDDLSEIANLNFINSEKHWI